MVSFQKLIKFIQKLIHFVWLRDSKNGKKLTNISVSCHKWFIPIINIPYNQQADCPKAATDRQTN